MQTFLATGYRINIRLLGVIHCLIAKNLQHECTKRLQGQTDSPFELDLKCFEEPMHVFREAPAGLIAPICLTVVGLVVAS